MNRNAFALPLALSALAVAIATCRESASPPTAVTLSASSRRDSLPVDSVNLRRDSVRVAFADSGGAPVQWTVSHGGAPWITLLATSGSGNGYVRWTRDPSELLRGVYVDTITVTATALHSAVSVIDSLVITGAPPTFITVRRAWRPGERDSMVARLSRDSTDGLFFSAQVAQYLATTDSVTVLTANPALAQSAGQAPQRAPMLGQAGQTWIMIGLDINLKFPFAPGSPQMDSLNWLGVSWYASPESTWKGRVIIGTTASLQRRKLAVNTALFDANFDTTGAGGGEARASTGQYWEANSGQITITSNVCSPASCADATFASGPWLGGLWHGILVGGNLISIIAPCVLGCPAPPDTFNVSFSATPVTGFAITCVFPSPCTGPGPAVIARLQERRRSFRELMAGDRFIKRER